MRILMLPVALALLVAFGGITHAAYPSDTTVVREAPSHGHHWGKRGGGWRCSGGYYHYGRSNGNYSCH